MKNKYVLLLLASSFLTTPLVHAETDNTHKITVYKNPSCGCCVKWIKYLESKNYDVTAVNSRNISSYKKQYGVPEKYAACHTGVIDGYVVEGHVTDRDIQELLLTRPEGVKGITVPGMPVGTPGMEHGDHRQPYIVYSFDKKGDVKIFKRHDK